MAIVTQTRIAVVRYGLAKYDLDLAQESMDIEVRSAQIATMGVVNQTEAELEAVRTRARATMAKYIRAIAYANAQAAYSRIQHSIGQDFDLGDVDAQSLAELSQKVAQVMGTNDRQMASPGLNASPFKPKIVLTFDSPETRNILLSGLTHGLGRSGFDIVHTDQPGATRVLVSLKLDDPAKGLRRGEVILSSPGRPTANYVAVLPEQSREATLTAMGEAAIVANAGNLKNWTSSGRK